MRPHRHMRQQEISTEFRHKRESICNGYNIKLMGTEKIPGGPTKPLPPSETMLFYFEARLGRFEYTQHNTVERSFLLLVIQEN